MMKRADLLEAFERDQMRQNQASYLENLRLFEALYREAQTLGVLPLADPLEGIDVDIRLARALHVRTATGEDC
ncbi:MAG TPA: hypothetical protein VKP65_02075 [Rhodothermales bacterium]|nr:hypothetical protein [Rhodothermales bacterium]